MKKIIIVTPRRYPVPAVRGGAVETLVEGILDENEKKNKLDITLVTVLDNDARKKEAKYRKTKIIHIDKSKFSEKMHENKIVAYLNFIAAQYLGRVIIHHPYVKKVWGAIKNLEYDAIIIAGGEDWIYGLISERAGRDKMCLYIHGECKGSNLLKKLYKNHLVVSNYIGRRLIMNGKMDDKRVRVVKNGIDVNLFSRSENYGEMRKVHRSEFDISVDDIVYVFWGRIVPEKGIEELLEAFGMLREKRENVRLLIIGSSDFAYNSQNGFTRKIADMVRQMKEDVVMIGYIPHGRLREYLVACDVAVLPSLCDEAAGLAMVEAVVAGLPLITTNVGGIKEYVGNQADLLEWDVNFVFKLYSEMLKMCDDSEYRSSWKKEVNLHDFGFERYYEDFVGVIEELC